jgi:ribose transport system permease protein
LTAKKGELAQEENAQLSADVSAKAGRRAPVGRFHWRRSFSERYGGVLLLLLLIAVFSIWEPHTFPNYSNFVGIVGNQATAGILALGLTLPLAAGVFDISIGGTMTLSVVVVTDLFQATNGHMPIVVAIAIPVVGSIAVGLVNSLLVVAIGVDPFIATIGTGSVLIGLSELIANGSTIAKNIPIGFISFGQAEIGRLPIEVLIFVGLAVLAWYMFEYTPLGRRIYATGAEREAARLSGIRTGRALTFAFCTSAVGAAIAGVLYAARLGSGPPDVGDGYLIGAYATAFLGATIIRPGRFNVVGLIVALLILAVGINGLQLAGVPFWIEETFQGAALLVAVVITKVRRQAGVT